MHAGQHVAHLRAVPHAWRQLRAARQARHDGRWLALEGPQDFAVAARDGRRHADVVRGQVGHQVQVIRQLLERQALEDGQHVLACDTVLLHGQEEVTVLDA